MSVVVYEGPRTVGIEGGDLSLSEESIANALIQVYSNNELQSAEIEYIVESLFDAMDAQQDEEEDQEGKLGYEQALDLVDSTLAALLQIKDHLVLYDVSPEDIAEHGVVTVAKGLITSLVDRANDYEKLLKEAEENITENNLVGAGIFEDMQKQLDNANAVNKVLNEEILELKGEAEDMRLSLRRLSMKLLEEQKLSRQKLGKDQEEPDGDNLSYGILADAQEVKKVFKKSRFDDAGYFKYTPDKKAA